MNLVKDYIPKGKVIPFSYVKEGKMYNAKITRRPGIVMVPKLIVVHTNGNTDSTLKGERAWLVNPTNIKAVSWNLMIHEKNGLEAIPWGEVAYHAGNYQANLISYGIELHEAGNFQLTLETAIEFIANRLTLDMKVKPEDVEKYVKPHRAFKSTECPRLLKGKAWDDFIDRIKKRMNGEKRQTVISFPSALKKGDKGKDVTTHQRVLNMDGAGLVVDGVFGDITLRETKAFQSRHGLTPDGFVGKLTQAKLTEVVNRKFEVRALNNQAKVAIIPKINIAKVELFKANALGLQETKAFESLNGSHITTSVGAFDERNGRLISHAVTFGVETGGNLLTDWGLIVDKYGKVSIGDITSARDARHGIGFSAAIYKSGKKILDVKGLTPSTLNARIPRHAIVETQNFLIEILVEGRNPILGFTGVTFYELCGLVEDAAKLVKESVIGAGEFNNGATVSIRCGYELHRTHRTPRAVPLGLGYYIK